MNRDHTWKVAVSFGCVLTAACLFTYATTRWWTTEFVLKRAGARTLSFLEERNLIYGDGNRDVEIPPDVEVASRCLLGRIGMAGGMY